MQNKKKKTEATVVDKRPTMAEWPVQIWAMEEIPKIFAVEARESMKGTFAQYHMVPDFKISLMMAGSAGYLFYMMF